MPLMKIAWEMLTNFSISLGASASYVRLGRVLIQWGLVSGINTAGNVASSTLTFPTAFNNTNYTINFSIKNQGSATTVIAAVHGEAGYSTSALNWNLRLSAGDTTGAEFTWIAIGEAP